MAAQQGFRCLGQTYSQVLLSKWNRHYEKEISEALNSDERAKSGSLPERQAIVDVESPLPQEWSARAALQSASGRNDQHCKTRCASGDQFMSGQTAPFFKALVPRSPAS